MIRNRRGASTSRSTAQNGTTAEPPSTQGRVYEEQIVNEENTAVTFAQNTLSPTFAGIIGRAIGLFIGYWLVFELWVENMALGLGRWIVGGSSVTEENVKLLPQGKEKKVKRRRREVAGGNVGETADDGYYPGMVNLSGVLCYMNSVLQSLASVTSLIDHLERITQLAVETDLPTPVTDALSDILFELNTPHTSRPRAIRPHALLTALHDLPQIRRLLSTREQQDAHELFIILAEAVSNEALKVAREVVRLRGIPEVLSLQAYCSDKGTIDPASPSSPSTIGSGMRGLIREKTKKARGLAQPWEGLVARRRVCRKCGYHGEVRMDTMGGMELPVPMGGLVTLESCIAEYLAPELLSGVTCEMCSLRQTIEYYQSESTRLSLPPSQSHLNGHATPSAASGSFSVLEHLPNVDSSDKMSDKRKKKAKEAKKVVTRLRDMLDSGSVAHYGENIPLSSGGEMSVKWQKVNSDSVRECILTRPPPTLRLHLDRSGMTPYGDLVKKGAHVAFPLILDLTRFIARGVWEERSQQQVVPTSGTQVLYRLESAILHYGATTSSGHFVCMRRKPIKTGGQTTHHRPQRVYKSCPDGCRCQQCIYFGQVRGEPSVPGKGWLSISDDDVEEVGDEALAGARPAVFMLFYERIGEYVDQVRVDSKEGKVDEKVGDGEVKSKL